MKKELIVLCGPSNSGKSSYAQKLRKKYTIINSDTIRKQLTGSFDLGSREDEVWSLFSTKKYEVLSEERSIILDACHISPQARWHALRGTNGYRKICILFNVKLSTILKRNKQEWVKKMWLDFQLIKPTKRQLLSEGFDKVKIIKK